MFVYLRDNDFLFFDLYFSLFRRWKSNFYFVRLVRQWNRASVILFQKAGRRAMSEDLSDFVYRGISINTDYCDDLFVLFSSLSATCLVLARIHFTVISVVRDKFRCSVSVHDLLRLAGRRGLAGLKKISLAKTEYSSRWAAKAPRGGKKKG